MERLAVVKQRQVIKVAGSVVAAFYFDIFYEDDTFLSFLFFDDLLKVGAELGFVLIIGAKICAGTWCDTDCVAGYFPACCVFYV